MSQVAKLFINGRSQAVRLPREFRFDTKEVYVRRDPATGNVILSAKPDNWDGFLDAINGLEVEDHFLSPTERSQGVHDRDPFEGWKE